jgi:hypothetical protein
VGRYDNPISEYYFPILSYRSARLHRLAESIPGLLKHLQTRAQPYNTCVSGLTVGADLVKKCFEILSTDINSSKPSVKLECTLYTVRIVYILRENIVFLCGNVGEVKS